MTQPLTIACLQLNAGSDIQENAEAITALAEQACDRGAQLLALPENAYFMRGDDRTAPPAETMDSHPGIAHARALATRLSCWMLVGSVFVSSGKRWANRCLLINPQGQLAAQYDKIHLFDIDFGDGETYRESDRIAAGKRMALAELPCGRLGMSICYDVRFPGLYRALAHDGAIACAVPSAFTHRTGQAHWHVLLRARAIENGCYIIAPAQCGTHPGGRRTYGHSLIIDPWGEVLAEAGEDAPGVTLATIDPVRVDAVRRRLPVLQHERALSR